MRIISNPLMIDIYIYIYRKGKNLELRNC